MRRIQHFKERYNIVNAARQLQMSVPALGERIQAGEIETEHHGSYAFISANEIDAFTVRRQQEFEAAQAAEAEAAALERQQEDGAHVVRLMEQARDIAGRYGWTPDQD